MPQCGMADKPQGTLAVDLAPKPKRLRFPNARPRPQCCDHGCGRPSMFCTSKNVWRCAKAISDCPVVRSRLTDHIQAHAHIFTEQDRLASSERARRLYKGAGNPIFGKPRSPRTRRKISRARVRSGVAKGERNPNWKGGSGDDTRAARLCDMATTRYKDWRLAVYTRDNYTCQFCLARNGNGVRVVLHADHIKPYAAFPELRYDVSNGRTLCRKCHFTTFKSTQSLIKQKQHERN